MKKILTNLFGLLCVSVLLSCNGANNKQELSKENNSTEKKVDEPIMIQTKILGLELGKSTLKETIKLIKENDWQTYSFGDAIVVMSPVSFGDYSWDGVTFGFTRGILDSATFSSGLDSFSGIERQKIFDSLANPLKKKYNSYLTKECNEEYIVANDGKMEVSLGHESDGTDFNLLLQYILKTDNPDDIAPSEL